MPATFDSRTCRHRSLPVHQELPKRSSHNLCRKQTSAIQRGLQATCPQTGTALLSVSSIRIFLTHEGL